MPSRQTSPFTRGSIVIEMMIAALQAEASGDTRRRRSGPANGSTARRATLIDEVERDCRNGRIPTADHERKRARAARICEARDAIWASACVARLHEFGTNRGLFVHLVADEVAAERARADERAILGIGAAAACNQR